MKQANKHPLETNESTQSHQKSLPGFCREQTSRDQLFNQVLLTSLHRHQPVLQALLCVQYLTHTAGQRGYLSLKIPRHNATLQTNQFCCVLTTGHTATEHQYFSLKNTRAQC